MSTAPRNVLITGGTSGIGLATAQRFVAAGDRVIITGRNQKALDEAKSLLGPKATAVRSDTGVLTEIDVLYAGLSKSHGPLDVIFVNAGVFTAVPGHETDAETFDRMVNINLKGAYFTATKGFAHLKDGGSVIFNGTALTRKGFPGGSTYSMTKAALVSLARTLAAEWGVRGIRVNVVSPGPIETPIYDKLGLSEEALGGMAKQIAGAVPLGRFGTPQELADAVHFIAGNTYMNGTELFIDGGFAQV